MKSARVLIGTLGLAALLGAASPSVMAADSGWYIGANAGQSRATIDNARIASGLLDAGFTTTSIGDNDKDFGFKLYGGYQFNRYFAIEGGYFDLGQFGFKAYTQPHGMLKGDIKLKGLNIDLLGILPITEKFSAFARIGADYAKVDDHFTGTGSVNVLDPSPSKRATNYKFGLGLQYNFVPSFGMRLEAERYRIDDAVGNKGDVDLYSLGLIYQFGRHAAAAAPPPEAPAPVVSMAPAPQPTPPVKVIFTANSLFGFNKSVLTDEGKQALDDFDAKLSGVDFDVITVRGYTDRIGSHE